MKANILITQQRKRKGFTLVELLVVIAIIASLAGLSYGPIMKHLESSARTEAISNGKMVHSALLGFMGQNDASFPNDDTAVSGSAASAEDCLQQLINGGFVSEEKYFWNKANGRAGICAITKPDNNGTLESSENAWGYTKNLAPGSDTGQVILFDSCTAEDTFSTASWKGKAIIVKVDGSCTAMNINYGDGTPLNDDGSGKTGPVEEKGGSSGSMRSVFEDLPEDAEIYTTSE